MTSFDDLFSDAIYYRDLKKFSNLVDASNINTICFHKNSVLFNVVYHGGSQLLEYCLSIGADVNLSFHRDRWTPLHVVARFGFFDCAKLLLDHGANVNAKTLTNQDNALSLALIEVTRSQFSMLKLLIDRGSEMTEEQLNRFIKLDDHLKRSIVCAIGIFKHRLKRSAKGPIDINVMRLIGKHIWSNRLIV